MVRYDIDNKVITHQIALGGTEMEQYSELKVVNGFVYAAIESSSGIGGTKTSPAFFQRDIWLVKLNKELQLLEQNTFGGNRNDLPIQLCFNPLVSSNLFLLGLTESNAFTGLKEVSNFGEVDAYFIELDPESLAQVADTVFGGVNADFASFGHNTSNGFEFILFSESGLTGNKTVPLKSFRDQWLINLEFEPNAIKEISVGTEFTVFPNPAKTEIQLKGVNSGKRYYLYDAQNRVVKSGRYNQNQSIRLNELASGVYFLRVQDHQQVSKVLVH